MEVPDNDQPVQSTKADWHQLLVPPYIYSAFEKATSELAWNNIEKASNWQKILPCPPIDPSEIESFNFSQFHQIPYPRQLKKSLADFTLEREKEWADKAEKWTLESKLIIFNKKEHIRRVCQDYIDEWIARGETTALRVNDLVNKWSIRYGNNNISWLRYLLITEKTIGTFAFEILNERKASFGSNKQPLSSTDAVSNNASNNQPIAPNEKKPRVYISNQIQTRLFKTLSDYVTTNQHSALVKLLEEGITEDRIWIKLRADSLAYIFNQVRGTRGGDQIWIDMRSTARWLAAYLNYGKNSSKPVSEATAYNVLRGNIIVEKANQIRLKT